MSVPKGKGVCLHPWDLCLGGGLRPGWSVSGGGWGSVKEGVLCPGSLCPVRGSLSRESLSSKGGLCPGSLCPVRGSLSREGVSVQGGGLCPGRESVPGAYI